MAAMTMTIEPEEFLGVRALAELEEAAKGSTADVSDVARTLMRGALAAKLADSGLPWAPSPEAVRKRAAEAARPDAALRRLMQNKTVRKYAASALAIAVLIVLWGGFIRGWGWTGFQANDLLWNWLHLLLLPVIVGTIPLWLQHGEYISRARTVTYLLVIAAFAVFVLAGYLVPLSWTGFAGNTLWNWLNLILLPAAIAALGVWPSAGRSLRPRHWAAIVVAASAWLVTIAGGYGLGWSWTGYPGNTLWDWLQLLLLPLLIPTILQPAALGWISGNAAQRALAAHAPPEARRETSQRAAAPAAPHLTRGRG